MVKLVCLLNALDKICHHIFLAANLGMPESLFLLLLLHPSQYSLILLCNNDNIIATLELAKLNMEHLKATDK